MASAGEQFADASPKIDKLNAENYHIWLRKIKLVLLSKGTWAYVTSGVTTPVVTNIPERTKYDLQQAYALADLLLGIIDECSSSVIDLEDPKVVWDTLRPQFNTVCNAAIASYLEKYQTIKMQHDEDIMTHVNRPTALENRLIATGQSLSRDERRRALLRGLLPEFDTIADLIREMDKGRATAIRMLITREVSLRRKSDPKDSALESAFQARSPHTSKCTRCARLVHLESDYLHNPESSKYKPAQPSLRKYRGKQRGKHRGNGTKKTNNDTKNDVGNSYITFISQCFASTPIYAELSNFKNNWYLDSGGTSRMSPLPTSKQDVSVGNGEQWRDRIYYWHWNYSSHGFV